MERFEHLPEAARTAVHERAPVEIAATSLLSPGGWAPFQLQLNLVHALRRTIDPADFHAFWRNYFTRTTLLDNMAPALAGAMRLFGTNPSMLVKTSGRLWSMVSRGCGELRSELHGDGSMSVRMSSLPTTHFDHLDDWVVAWAGVIHGAFDLIDRPAQVEVSAYEPSLGIAVFEAQYEHASGPACGVPLPVTPRDSEAPVYRT